ncbi:hypothetical protein GCM10010172_76720 [Paractinoplanes ferrugineus]|uniref:MerR family transcriptional regulator n=1 Tax=Paractinoplanes ferrugineus TaxID=113564 RepID=UPI001EF18A23|nr:MerR family transcriptional regulator [Actinoplanes ferrugineus]
MAVAWSITEVAQMAGVTSRTLRHYDAIGLLTPAYLGANGYRFYEQPQMLHRDRVEALRVHQEWLRTEQQRLARLAATVARTIKHLDLQLLRSGVAPEAPEALDVIAEHHRAVARHWSPDTASYAGLGEMYLSDPQYRARYDVQDPALAQYYRDAITAFAQQRLN